jgi:hypothetical protein
MFMALCAGSDRTPGRLSSGFVSEKIDRRSWWICLDILFEPSIVRSWWKWITPESALLQPVLRTPRTIAMLFVRLWQYR